MHKRESKTTTTKIENFLKNESGLKRESYSDNNLYGRLRQTRLDDWTHFLQIHRTGFSTTPLPLFLSLTPRHHTHAHTHTSPPPQTLTLSLSLKPSPTATQLDDTKRNGNSDKSVKPKHQECFFRIWIENSEIGEMKVEMAESNDRRVIGSSMMEPQIHIKKYRERERERERERDFYLTKRDLWERERERGR